MRRAAFMFIAIMTLTYSAECVLAQSNKTLESPLNHTGTWDLSVWVREAVGNSANGDIGDAYVSMAGFSAGYVFAQPVKSGPMRSSLEYYFDIMPVFVLTKPQLIYGAGLSPVGFKWNFAARRQPYLDFSLGGVLGTRDVPAAKSSNLNFTVAADGGATIVRRPRSALTANVGFWHLSNAHMGLTNPSLNALQFGVAYHWYHSR